MVVFLDDEDFLPIEEQVNCLVKRDENSRPKRLEVVRKSLNRQFMAARVSATKYIELSRRLNSFSAS